MTLGMGSGSRKMDPQTTLRWFVDVNVSLASSTALLYVHTAFEMECNVFLSDH